MSVTFPDDNYLLVQADFRDLLDLMCPELFVNFTHWQFWENVVADWVFTNFEFGKHSRDSVILCVGIFGDIVLDW